MEGDITGVVDAMADGIEGISTTVWLALGVLAATLLWIVKWAVTVLFVQGRGISLITVPFSRLAGKILEDKFAQKLADTKVLPKLHIPRSWDEFNRFNGHVANRMRIYRELVYLVQAKFNGPTAVSLRLAVRYFEKNFVETFQTAEREFRTLDRLDGDVRAIHRGLHSELAAATHPLERERIQTEKSAEMARIRLKQVIANRPMNIWLRKRSGRYFSAILGWLVNRIWSVGEEREIKTQKRDLDRKLRDLRRDIDEQSRLIFARHEEEVVGICLELIEHDQMFLQHLYHRFWLEMESLTFSVASGRLMHMIASDTEAGAQARRELGLSGVGAFDVTGGKPDIHAIRAAIRADSDLQRYVGLGPEAVLEGSLEPYLRVKLLLGRISLPGYTAHWIAHLPPPAEFGRAQAEYDHFSHQLAWLKTSIPGIFVQENGLVLVDEPGIASEPPLAAE